MKQDTVEKVGETVILWESVSHVRGLELYLKAMGEHWRVLNRKVGK